MYGEEFVLMEKLSYIYSKIMLPHKENLKSLILLQDGARSHIANNTKEYFKNNNIFY